MMVWIPLLYGTMLETGDGFTRFDIERHTVITEPDRMFHFIVRGDLNVVETKRVQRILFDFGNRCGQAAFLVNISEMTGLDNATRQAWVHVDEPLPIEFACLYGGSFAIRTLATTVYRAGKVLKPSFFQFSLELPKDEASARAAIAAHRASTQASSA
jgi:hypothetical protein